MNRALAATKKTASPVNPAGLSAKEVGQIFADLRWEAGDARARYEELTRAPDLPFPDFLRWCLAHHREVPVRWAIDFFAFWGREGTETLPHEEVVSLFGRLELRPDPDHPGRLEDRREEELIEALASFFAHDFTPFRDIYRKRLARGDWHPDACHAFWLVDWLLGEEVPGEEVEKLGRWLAHEHYWQLTSTPRSANRHLQPLIRRAGLGDSTYRALGLALLGTDGWRAALQALFDGDTDLSFDRVGFVDVIDPMPLDAALPRMIEEGRPQDSSMAQAFVDYVHRRPETAGELLRVGQALSARDPRPYMAELLCLEGARRLLDAGEVVPAAVDEMLTLTLRYPAPLPLYRAVLPRLPQERRLAILDRDLINPDSRGASITGLLDDEIVAEGPLFRRAIAHPRFDAAAAGQLGGRGAQALEEALGGAVDPAMRPRLEHALLEAAANHVRGGGVFDERWSFFLILAPPQSEAAQALYRHLPEPLRSDLLLEAVREWRVPAEVLAIVVEGGLREEVMGDFVAAYRARDKSAYHGPLPAGLEALNRAGAALDAFTPRLERFRALAAGGPEPREVVYVCQIVPAEQASPATSLTLFGGPAPVAARARPRSSRHVLTVDLRDAPELGSRFPGARAVSLFMPREPDLDSEDEEDAYFWRGFTEAEVAAALAGLAKRKRTLVVHRCSVPSSMFEDDGDEALRGALVHFPGYLLGGPITIQEDTASKDPTFMAQLGEDFDLPLGDAGLLYSYTDHATWDCH